MWLLKTSDGDEFPFTFRILPGNIKTVGRAPRADFIVEAPLVSRLHCRLTAGAAELEVVDLDSTNGTYVNGQRVTRVVLRSGDRLGVGKVEFVVTRATERAEGATETLHRVKTETADGAEKASSHKERR